MVCNGRCGIWKVALMGTCIWMEGLVGDVFTVGSCEGMLRFYGVEYDFAVLQWWGVRVESWMMMQTSRLD